MDIKKMLSEAIQAEEIKKAAQARETKVYDEFHAKQLAWAIPLLVAGRQLAEELAPFQTMKVEIGDTFVSLTVRLESDTNGYPNDLDYTVTAHLPTDEDPRKRFICTSFGSTDDVDGDTEPPVTSHDSVEDAMSWLVKQAARGIGGSNL